MIKLLILFFSMFIQFGAVGITPFDYSDYQYSNEIITIFSNILNYDLNNDYQVVYATPNYATGYVVCPLDIYTSGAEPFSCTFNNYITDDDFNVIGYTVTYTNCRIYYNSGGNVVWGDYQNGNIWYTNAYFDGYAPANASNYHKIMKINEDYLPFVINNIPFVINGVMSDNDILGSNIGSIDVNGHSSGGSPLETLGGVSWATMTGHSSGGAVAPSPHSSSTHFNTTTQSPEPTDSKTDNLLYMLGNKLADITENTSGIISALGGVMYNVMQGASAIFNGISAFNDNVVNFASYLTAVPTSQDISDALNECENICTLRDLSESINIWSELGLTQVNSAPTYTFNFNGTMFDSLGNFTLNFNFLDSTKNLWQPLFIALLYFNLLVTILTGLPDLIQGRGET